MRLYAITAFSICLILFFSFPPPAGSNPSSFSPSVFSANLQGSDSGIIIGSNLSWSTYEMHSNVTVINGSMSVIDTAVTYWGNLHVEILNGSLSIVNSSIMPGNQQAHLSLWLNGTAGSTDTVTFLNSTVDPSGVFSANCSNITLVNSSLGGNATSSYVIDNSSVNMLNSTIDGFSNESETGEIMSGSLTFAAGPVDRCTLLTLQDSQASPELIDNQLSFQMNYSGNNPGNGSYLVVNISGKQLGRINFPDTGSSLERRNFTQIMELPAMLNSSSLAADLTVFLVYNNSKFSNSTVWSISMQLLSNDSVGMWGIDKYDLVLYDSGLRAIDSAIPLETQSWFSFGRELSPRVHRCVAIDSRIYLASCRSSYGAGNFSESSIQLLSGSRVSVFCWSQLRILDHGNLVSDRFAEILPAGDNQSLNNLYNESKQSFLVGLPISITYQVLSDSNAILFPVFQVESGGMPAYFGNSEVEVFRAIAYTTLSEAESMSGTIFSVVINVSLPLLSISMPGSFIAERNGSLPLSVNDRYASVGLCSFLVSITGSGIGENLSFTNAAVIAVGKAELNLSLPGLGIPPGHATIAVTAVTENGTALGENVTSTSNTTLIADGVVDIAPSIGLINGTHWLNVSLQNDFSAALNGSGLEVVLGQYTEISVVLPKILPGKTCLWKTDLSQFDSNTTISVTLTLPPGYDSYRATNETVSINYDPTCNVILSETGLPSGAQWYVLLGGSIYDSNTSQILLKVPDGYYNAIVQGPPGYGNATRVMLPAYGSTLNLHLSFRMDRYWIEFEGIGIPFTVPFHMSDGPLNATSSGTYAGLWLAPGTYSFYVWADDGYKANSPVLYLQVNSTGFMEIVQFWHPGNEVAGLLSSFWNLFGPAGLIALVVMTSWLAWVRLHSQRIVFST
ncbi:MAG: hypothetical protein M1151_03450 [Candidatus Thermoplasmatota archaeon]|nr:hypothetical protein [Candidatus Thermoplasmatota archaeon]MCL5785711.1 hypothetical protein [Candidatus Thermoplasmatota archaeon]